MTPPVAAPMRRVVLYIDSLKIGGAERVTLSFARWLRQNGWTPIVLTRQSGDMDFYPTPSGVERVIEPPEPRWLRLLGRWGFLWRVQRLRRWLYQQRVGLAIGMTTKPSVKLLLACRPLNIPCAVSERNFPPLKRMALPWGVLRRISYPWAALHIVQTRATGEWLRRNLEAEPQLLLPNPVQWPQPVFEPQVNPASWLTDAGVPEDAPLLLAAGTKSHQKGFDKLVRAFAVLVQRGISVHLVILGLTTDPYHGVNQQQSLCRLLKSQPLARRQLHFPGRVGNMSDWYQRATLFTLPSRYEGFPNVLLEAMAEGCCCVASDCPQGPSDLVEDGQNGVLLPRRAGAREWAEVMIDLLSSPDKRHSMQLQALKVRERYSDSALQGDFIRAMEQLV